MPEMDISGRTDGSDNQYTGRQEPPADWLGAPARVRSEVEERGRVLRPTRPVVENCQGREVKSASISSFQLLSMEALAGARRKFPSALPTDS